MEIDYMIFCARLPSFSIMFLRFMFISILHCFLWLNNVQLYECVCALSCIQLFAAPWIVACQAPLSTGFSRQEYWSRVPFPSPRNLSYPGIKPGSPALQADSLPAEPQRKPSTAQRQLKFFWTIKWGKWTTKKLLIKLADYIPVNIQ